ncbi:MAG: agmatinase [Actinomycetota bacterium]
MSVPVLLGLPFDGASSFLRGPAEAPAAIRRVLHAGSANWSTERGIDLDPELGRWRDAGDLDVPDGSAAAVEQIRTAAGELDAPLVAIGGDHLVTYPLVSALAARHPSLTILHVDAHPDLYDELDGDRLSHACPFARIMEGGLAQRLVQFGIRTATAHQHEQAERFGVETHTASGWDGRLPDVHGDVYVTIDVDGLDPAFAPGVSHHEPGGLTTRQVLGLVHQVADADGVRLVGADVVEVNPRRDHHDMTAMLGGKLVKELLGAMVEQR